MALPSSGNITLQQIQTEFGTIGLAASAVAGIPDTSLVGSNLQPDRSMRDFLGRSANSVTLSINDVSQEISFPFYDSGFSSSYPYGSLSPTSDNLWENSNIGELYTHQGRDGITQGTYLTFNTSLFYTGPFYITYRGTKYTLTATSGSDPYTWFTGSFIFGGYGSGTVVISTQ